MSLHHEKPHEEADKNAGLNVIYRVLYSNEIQRFYSVLFYIIRTGGDPGA